MKKILSIQDISCYGQCSLTVALPILSAFGIETAILPSAILSTHTGGFTGFTVHDLTEEMPKILNHWKSEGIKFDAIYTGYIGDARQFDIIRDAKNLLNPGGELLVDPAMADFGKLYSGLDKSIVAGMRTIVKEADLVLPNLTETAFLLDVEYKTNYSKGEIKALLSSLCEMGAKRAAITGVSYEEGKIGVACLDSVTGEETEYFTEWVPKVFHGTGDVFSSIAIANYLKGKPLSVSLSLACDFVLKCINRTLKDSSHTYGVMFEEVLSESRN